MSHYTSLKQIESRGFFHIKPGLERIEVLLNAFGNPQDSYPSIHIAGTNGKGSVAASLSSILVESRFKTGLYTSPELVDICERFQINGLPIRDNVLSLISKRLIAKEKKLGIELSYFEFLTAIAFLWFSQEKVDIAVIEVGMGGRWDATNILKHPLVSVITSIGLDHVQWLGKTEIAIAREKAGIIKPGIPVVSGVRGKSQAVIHRYAHQNRSPFYQYGVDFKVDSINTNWKNQFQTIKYCHSIYKTSLLGNHQAQNMGLVLKTTDLLRDQHWSISEKNLKKGLEKTRWPGRFELIRLENGHSVLLDVAHNPAGLKTLLNGIKQSPWKNSKTIFVFGAYKDKDIQTMVHLLSVVATHIVFTALPSERSRHWPREEKNPIAAFKKAISMSSPSDLLVVTGSLSLVGCIRKELHL